MNSNKSYQQPRKTEWKKMNLSQDSVQANMLINRHLWVYKTISCDIITRTPEWQCTKCILRCTWKCWIMKCKCFIKNNISNNVLLYFADICTRFVFLKVLSGTIIFLKLEKACEKAHIWIITLLLAFSIQHFS